MAVAIGRRSLLGRGCISRLQLGLKDAGRRAAVEVAADVARRGRVDQQDLGSLGLELGNGPGVPKGRTAASATLAEAAACTSASRWALSGTAAPLNCGAPPRASRASPRRQGAASRGALAQEGAALSARGTFRQPSRPIARWTSRESSVSAWHVRVQVVSEYVGSKHYIVRSDVVK